MKKILLQSVMLLIFDYSVAQQDFNKSYHDINEAPNSFVVSINGDIYFTTQSLDAQNFSNNYLYKHTGLGALAFKIPVFNYLVVNGFESLDHKLITVGYKNFTCDIPDPVQNNFITKMDINGNVIFNSSYTVATGDSPRACVHYSDSSYITFTNKLLIKHNKNGQALSTTSLALNGISSALVLPNNNILLSAYNSFTPSLVEVSPMGTIVNSFPFPVILTKLAYYGTQNIIGRGTDGKFHKFSPAINALGSNLNSGGMIATEFVSHQDTIYYLSVSPSGVPHYMVMDTSFNSITSSPTLTNKLHQNALCLNNRKVAILSTGNLPINSTLVVNHYFASLNVINKTSGNTFKSDVALTSLYADSVYTECNPFALNPSDYLCSVYLRPKVKIKNVGITPITNVKLNCFKYPAVSCGHYFYQEKFTGLNLAPGDSTFLVGTQFIQRNSGMVSSPYNVDYCFYLTLPNGETDKTVEDNDVCKTFTFLITSIKDHAAINMKIEIAPNPFNDNLSIKSEVDIKKIQIINSLGMLVKESSVNRAQTDLSLSELYPGVYFLKMETDKGSVIKKVVKQ